MINCRGMTKNQIVSSIRRLLKEAKDKDTFPKGWKITVSSGWTGLTPRITLKVRNHEETKDEDTKRKYENELRKVANFLNYNDSQAEYDHFDVGYYLDIFWM